MGFLGNQGLIFAVAIDHAKSLLEGHPLQLAFAPPLSNGGMKALMAGAGTSEADRIREEGTK